MKRISVIILMLIIAIFEACTPVSSSVPIEFSIAERHHTPVAREGNPQNISLAAKDSNNDSLTYIIVGKPSYGDLSGTGPTLVYTPDPGFVGVDSFTFQVNDGISNSNTATVTITVLSVADINADTSVNVLDLVLVGQHWGETGPPGWVREDVNDDGSIDVLDMVIIGQHWSE